MNHITTILKIHLKNKFTWFLLPWSIVLASFIVNLTISILLGGKITIYTGGIASLYIFMLVLGAITLNDTFPFAIGFSLRRTDYFLGTALMALITSVIAAVLLLLLSVVESDLFKGWGVSLHFFSLPYFNSGPLLGQFWSYFAIVLHMYFLGFASASVYRRFGRTGVIIFFGLLALLPTIAAFICTRFNLWDELFAWFIQQPAYALASWLALAIVVYALAAFGMLRKTTV